MQKLKKVLGYPIFQNTTFLAIVWFVLVLVGYLGRLHKPIVNNYLIFSRSFWHSWMQQPLYLEYPAEYRDLFLYGIPFTSLIAPFALLPDAIGCLLWNIASCFLLFWGIKQLKLEKWKFAFIILFSANELFSPILSYQYNIAIAGMIIFSYALIEQKKDFWAALFIMLGTMTKIYGIVGLAFFFFSKRKLHLLVGMLCWGAVLFVLPMLYSSPQYVLSQYEEWLHILLYKNELNTFCSYTNVSLLGMVRKITHVTTYSDLWIIVPGLILFAAPYFRLNQYNYKKFRLLYLSSALLFLVLFSTGTESNGYIGAIIAVAIWYVNTPTRQTTPVLNTTLLVFCFILTSLSPTDLFPREFRKEYIVPYALKALPCVLIWLKIVWEQLTQNFSEPLTSRSACKIESVDVVLPCHNPANGWEQVLIDKHAELTKSLGLPVRFIVVNDGSLHGVTSEAIGRLQASLPNTVFVNNKENRGKGAAVRDGLVHADSSVVLYTDYDFPYEIHSVCDVVNLLREGYDIVIANRNKTYYSELTLKRKIMSYASRFLNYILLGLTHTDTQGGLKGFNQRGKFYLEHTRIDRFLFDTEFIYKASKDDGIFIAETSVNLRENVVLPNMRKGVLVEEFKNLLTIAWRG